MADQHQRPEIAAYPAGRFQGFIDALRNGQLSGWCHDTTSTAPVAVELLVGETVVATTTANLHRPDLEAAKIGDGRHAFAFDLRPLNIADFRTEHPRLLKVRVAGDDTVLALSHFHPFLNPDGGKHLRPYLASYLTAPQKRDCQISHNRFWFRHALHETFGDLSVRPLPVWRLKRGDDEIGIDLLYANFAPAEGELAFNFSLNAAIIATLTFAVVPGKIFGRAEPLILFAGGLQGRPYCRQAIRAAARLNSEIHPSASLLIALRALGEAWGLCTIAAISAYQQISFTTMERQRAYVEAYDGFWKTSGATEASIPGKLYFIPIHAGPKPPPSNAHPRRTLRKRLLKDEIYREMVSLFENHCLNPAFYVEDSGSAAPGFLG